MSLLRIQIVSIFFSILSLTGCRTVTGPFYTEIFIERAVIADMFGDHDGAASTEELTSLDLFFTAHSQAWCITGFPSGYRDKREIPVQEVQRSLQDSKSNPYPSEQALRTANADASFRTPNVAVSVFRLGGKIHLQRYYRAPGPHFSKKEWTPMFITP